MSTAVNISVDSEIQECLTAEPPKSFFLFAGAGSGKTRALVTSLNQLRVAKGKQLQFRGQQVAVITYTNAACDEITRRLDFDPLISVSTIHSFVWELIRGFNADIRQWLRVNLTAEIAELNEELRTGRPGTKTAIKRERDVASKTRRLTHLNEIKAFVYSPTGDNRGRDSLNHSEVIKIAADFLNAKPLMQRLLTTKFPILLIDESQDTNKSLMEAFLSIQSIHKDRFRLGIFGDQMQRIYSEGKVDLGRNLPPDWSKPALRVNYRCPRRVIRLINTIRSAVDDHTQNEKPGAVEGFARLFVVSSERKDKTKVEEVVRQRMAIVTGDPLWNQTEQVKVLTIEHHMAAARMGFLDMFEPLYRVDEFKTGLLDGSLSLVRCFSANVLPLLLAKRAGDEFAATAVIRNASPLLSRDALKAAGGDQLVQVRAAKSAMDSLMALWSGGGSPRIIDVLQNISASQLFEVPEALRPFVSAKDGGKSAMVDAAAALSTDGQDDENVSAISLFLNAPFEQIKSYSDYVAGLAPFDTHQGVKGLEFPRVQAIMDDEETRGFMFSYEKLFEVKEKTKADLDNERKGAETGIDRTRRLLYVTCSRSENSLALVAYSTNPSKVREHAMRHQWFEDGEIEFVT